MVHDAISQDDIAKQVARATGGHRNNPRND